QRADDADDDLGDLRRALRRGAAGARRQRTARHPLAALALLLRPARRRPHAGGGVAAAAVRPVARTSGLLAAGDAVFIAAGDRSPLSASRAELVPWAWGMNGALSVIGATLAVFIAMNWGFSVTLLTGAATYLTASVLLRASYR